MELAEEANRSLGLDWTYADGRFAAFQPTGNAIRDLAPEASLAGTATYPGTGQVFYQGVGSCRRSFSFVSMLSFKMEKGPSWPIPARWR